MKIAAKYLLAAVVGCLIAGHYAAVHAAETAKEEQKISVAEGELKLTMPEGWQKKKPENRIIEHEFAVPPSDGDKETGRVTVMGAGGTVDANIERWIGQFSQPDGSDTHKIVKQKEMKVGGIDVRTVDISGTYNDSRGPFSGIPAVERPKYRMMAAIISSKKAGNYFVKFYGPQQTVADNEKAFQSVIDSLQAK